MSENSECMVRGGRDLVEMDEGAGLGHPAERRVLGARECGAKGK